MINLKSLLLGLFLGLIAAQEKARQCGKGALLAQAALESALKACQYKNATALTTTNFSFSLIATGCDSNGQACCVDSGPFSTFLKRYTCGDKILYYEPPYASPPAVQYLGNGTVVIGRYETIVQQGSGNLVVHNYNYYWNPASGKDKYHLSYIDGNDFNCPTYLYELQSCNNC